MTEPLLFGALLLSAGVIGYAVTGAVRRYALARDILDVPNARSSHSVPTPRGGGVGIVAVVVAGVLFAWAAGAVPTRLAAALGVGGLIVALVGWIDDRRGLSRSIRLVCHFAVAAGAVSAVGGLDALRLGPITLELGVLGYGISILFVAWLTNLYNFMDGIDGIAAGEAATAGVFGGALLLYAGAPGLAAVAFLLAAAATGFLVWNWSPARIFMGDVGSGFLGFQFATLALASEAVGAVPLLAWIVLLGVFIFDATATLIRRALRGERWYEEHRSHAYQRAVQSGWTHVQVTTAVLLLNVVLGALAVLATTWRALLLPAGGIALALLAAAYLWIERRMPPPVPTTRGAGTSGRQAVRS